VFCACEIILLFPVVFYMVTAVHNFEFRLVIKETPNKWRLLGRSHAVIETHVFDRIYMFSPDRCHECNGTLPTLCRSTAFSSVRDSMRKIILKIICCLNLILLNDSISVAEVI
jgi:hypothetical protein